MFFLIPCFVGLLKVGEVRAETIEVESLETIGLMDDMQGMRRYLTVAIETSIVYMVGTV